MKRIFIVGTADTKGEELAYLRTMVAEAGGEQIVVDIGIGRARCDVDIPATEIAACHAGGGQILHGTDRGEAVTAMGEAFAQFVSIRRDIDAMIGIGGGGGTLTIMRTTAAESRQVGGWIAEKLNRCSGPVRFLIPEKGVSVLDAPGQPFHDPEADTALFNAIKDALHQTADRRLKSIPCHINDPEFSQALVRNFLQITR
jgi:uncharacterized protein (UPF0261 family)